MTPSVELRYIKKKFASVLANDRVNFTLMPGEIHSIVGGNGAGKSTLVKIIYGMLRPDEGTIHINGTQCIFNHPKDARNHHIGMVHQEMLLIDTKTVLENIILGAEPCKFGLVRYENAETSAEQIIKSYKLDLDLHRIVSTLTVGERQRILITRLLYQHAKILILDEPTAALTPQETDILFSVLNSLKEDGASVIFISHKLPEVFKFSDRISVMRAGRMVGTAAKTSTNPDEIMELMCGEKPPSVKNQSEALPEEEIILKADSITCEGGIRRLKNISFTVHRGEIFGILGVDGNGQKELEEIFSGQNSDFSGKIYFRDIPLPHGDSAALKKNNISYIPSHREYNGIINDFSVTENIILGRHCFSPLCRSGFMQQEEIEKLAERLINEYEIQPANFDAPMLSLSGGNQQKVVLGRELYSHPDVLIACNPARGVDIRTARITFILNDIAEAMILCHRIAILYNGKLTGTFTPDEYSETELGYYMTGGR